MPGCSNSAAPSDAGEGVDAAVRALRRGGVVVYPTETFYGLGVDATNPVALDRLRWLKVRAAGKPIAVLVSSVEMVTMVASAIPPMAARLMERFWPGPLTLVLPAKPEVDAALTAGSGTIGVRWSSHPVATALVTRLAKPVTTPSANPAGAEPPVTVDRARAYFGDGVDVYVDGGELTGGLGSTVVEVVPALRIVRQGAIAEADIRVVEQDAQASRPPSRR